MAPPTHRLWLALLALLSWLVCPAAALAGQTPPPPSEPVGLVLGVRGVGEVWQDPLLIAELGRGSRFGGTGALSYRVWRFVGVEMEVGYHRMSGTGTTLHTGRTLADATTFEMVPMAISASAMHRIGGVELFGALGTAFTVFHSSCETADISGTKIGPSILLGARIDTGMVQPSIRRDAGAQLQSLDLELVVGRRQHQAFGVGEGLDLSAWRVGIGLMARL